MNVLKNALLFSLFTLLISYATPEQAIGQSSKIEVKKTQQETPALQIEAQREAAVPNGSQERAKEPLAKELAGQIEIAKVSPVIESVFTVPVGALRPGSKLYVKGKHFGKYKGKLLLYRYSSPIELVDVVWTDENNATGVVPDETKVWKNQNVTIKLKTADKRYSNPKEMGFIATEEDYLGIDDIIVEKCSFSRSDYCGRVKHMGSCDSDWPESIHNDLPVALKAMHCNSWGALEDESGIDKYSIHLKNGWVIMGVVSKHSVTKTSEAWVNGPYPTGANFIGKSSWSFQYDWDITPNDRVQYTLVIRVEGPVGTYYK